MKFSIIIPVLNESGRINDLIRHTSDIFRGYNFEIIVADGDEHGSTINNIKTHDDIKVIKILSPKGRAVQMNTGAAASAGDVLIFLHADTYLPAGSAKEIESVFTDGKAAAGAFDLSFDVKSSGMNIIASFARRRSRITRVPFGDQAIFVRTEYFKKAGGFKEIPLMEDVEFMKRIRKSGDRIFISKLRVVTSARKWINEGMVKNTLRNWRNRILYKLGWSPEKLAGYYYRSKKLNIIVLIFLLGVSVYADNSIRFEFNNLSDWEPLNFPKIKNHSSYSIVKEKGKNILLCESNASASGLILKRTFNIYNYNRLKWKWKISNVYNNTDPQKKSGDDYPIRVYIIFKYDPGRATLYEKAKYNALRLIYGEYPPHSSVNYVWSSKVISGRIIASPYTDRVKLVLLQKGAEKANTWVTEEVNVLEDYRAAFGENPPETASLAVMNDSDNTKESAKSYIEFIEVK
ncbi:MAG TPA: TIGR04283 family arsenosugar biosynthesis glycosyltransferase [Spirochaetota bacterium]|nr:TIGR04283 family arsenosugar biosynthesis glycosyltransferase [Spirochaetota bacterium]